MYPVCFIAMFYGGLNYEAEGLLPRWVFVLGAFSVQWFSLFDAMDGQRARRLKCGTPIGRVLDEAGDMVQYTLFSIIMGYVTKVGPGWYMLGYFWSTLPCYA